MSTLLDLLRGFDHLLFHKINAVWTCSVLDWTMPIVTDLHRLPIVAFLIAPALLAYWLYVQRKFAVKVLIVTALIVGMTDLSCHRVIKPLFHRARPEQAGVPVVLREGHHNGYGFPSNHAVNMFALSTFLSSVYPILTIPLFAAAVVIAYSRVYVGVHFPLDVLGGALVGLVAGWIGCIVVRRLKILEKNNATRTAD